LNKEPAEARSGYRPDVRGICIKVKNPDGPAMIRAREVER
jgi:hypothetical protein